MLGIGWQHAVQTLPLRSWQSGKDGKGEQLVSDAGMEDMLETSSEEGTVMVTSLEDAGEGFTEEAASEPWFSFILSACYTKEIVFANRYAWNLMITIGHSSSRVP